MNLRGSSSGPLLHAIAMQTSRKTGLDRLKEIKDQLDEIREDLRADMFGPLGKLEWPERNLCYQLDPFIRKVQAMIKANDPPPDQDWEVTVSYQVRAPSTKDAIEHVKLFSYEPTIKGVRPA